MMDDELQRQVREGLTANPKRLPFALLYDDLGSALFEAITLLPEYGLTDADHRLIAAHAGEAVAAFDGPIELAELGPGSGSKASIVVSSARQVQDVVRFFAIDVSAAALEACGRSLERLSGVEVVPVQASYLTGVADVQARRSRTEPLLLLFLGSNIGNLDRDDARAFLARLGDSLRPGDGLLVSADLTKPAALLDAAYDDSLGVTAAFNLNVLARMNRELGANFDVRSFGHHARYDEAHRRVEMHLQSEREQRVRVEALGLDLTLERGERIWTESSHKFEAAELTQIGGEAGLTAHAQWIDEQWPFALTLFVVPRPRGAVERGP